jgi:heme-degrading monooxygenase HmoA
MMTIVTHCTIEPGKEPAWDTAFQQRVEAAKKQPGWVGAQLCIPADAVNKRIIIGTWETRAHWEAWHNSPSFQKTREQMEGSETEPRNEWWHEVILEEHRSGADESWLAPGQRRSA